MQPWPCAILLMDLNAFFASVEQLDYPELRGKAVAVTNGEQGSCIITCSYEARKFGIKTGMRFFEAQKRCPHLIKRASRPKRYAEVSAQVMAVVAEIAPDIEIFSIDEAFIDITACQKYLGTPECIGNQLKKSILNKTGLSCSIGISGDKTTAKYAAKQQGPNSLTLIPPWESEKRLFHVPVTELCGIAEGIGHFLSRYGVVYCGQMKELPVEILSKRFGPLGKRIWLMAQGKDPSPVQQVNAAPKSIGHGKVLPPRTNCRRIIKSYLRHMSEKVAKRLRQRQLLARTYYFALKTDRGTLKQTLHLAQADNDGQAIYRLSLCFLKQVWQGEIIKQVQVTALNPHDEGVQLDLFAEDMHMQRHKNAVMDLINHKFGDYTLLPADLMTQTNRNDVIAPAWRPFGIRKTV